MGLEYEGVFARLAGAWLLIARALPAPRPPLKLGRNRPRRWCDRQRAAGLERGMRDAPDMPELQEDYAGPGMHCIHHLTPARDLRLRVNAGNAGIAEAGGNDGRSFGDDQSARRRALRVILHVQRPRRKAWPSRTHPRQRRHRNTMLELIGTDLEGRKQRRIFHVYLEIASLSSCATASGERGLIRRSSSRPPACLCCPSFCS